MGRVIVVGCALLLAGCQVGRVDVTPGPPLPTEVMVVEVTALGTGGTVELVRSNVRRHAPTHGIDPGSESFRRWRQETMDSGHLVYAAKLQPGQTASDVVYNIAIPDEPIKLDIRFDGVSMWKGRVGTKIGGPNHVKLVVQDGDVVEKTVEVVEPWLEPGGDFHRVPPHGWTQPDDHVRFEIVPRRAGPLPESPRSAPRGTP